jgi:Ca-activated chloride channel family protein
MPAPIEARPTLRAARGIQDQRRHIPPVLFLLALALMSLAMARSQAIVGLPRVEGIVILAFDVFGSMAAEEVHPNRMEAAKAAAQELVENQPLGVRVGVVASSDSGFSVQTPTDDKEAILAALRHLTPQRGTSLANGILASLNTLAADRAQAPRLYTNPTPAPTPSPTPVSDGTLSPAVIVLITDGENNEAPDPLALRRRRPTAASASTRSAWAARRGPR